MVKNSPANAEDIRNVGSNPGWGRFPGGGYGNPLQYSCLEHPMDRGAWQATVHRIAKSQTWLKRLSMQETQVLCFWWRDWGSKRNAELDRGMSGSAPGTHTGFRRAPCGITTTMPVSYRPVASHPPFSSGQDTDEGQWNQESLDWTDLMLEDWLMLGELKKNI